jgi:peptidyl-prolyl cis-trans isomerase C
MSLSLRRFAASSDALCRTAARLTSRSCSVTLVALLMLVPSSCARSKPDGQVVAIVNGVEVTLAELNEEAKARGLAVGSDRRMRAALLRDLIDRKLLVAQAKKRRLDKTPEHLLAVRRLTEILTAQELLAASTDEAEAPDARELQQFISSHPRAFGQRVAMSVDLVAFPASTDPKLSAALARAKSLEEAQAMLARARVPASRSIEVWDSANVDERLSDRLLGMKANEVAVVPGPDRMVAARLLSAVPQPVPQANQLTVARELFRRKRSEAILQQLLGQARAEADIKYQRGFAPDRTRPAR